MISKTLQLSISLCLLARVAFAEAMVEPNQAPAASVPAPVEGAPTAPAPAAEPAAPAANAESSARMDSIDERVTELEAGQALQRVRFSGVLINRYEHFTTSYGVPGDTKEKDVLNPFSMYFALNADFDLGPHLKVYSTLAMSKFWQNDGRYEYAGNWQASEGGSYDLEGSNPRFDRAYMAYKFESFPLTLAIGRMPTNNGVPINQLDGMAREGTYPRFAYNAIFDGIAAVFDFSRYLPAGIAVQVRAFYTPNVNIDKHDRTRQLVDGTHKIDSQTLQYAILSELSTTRLAPITETLRLYHMFYQYRNFYNDGTNPSTDPATNPPDNPLDSAYANMIYGGLENIGNIGLNVSYSTLLYHSYDVALDGTGGQTSLSVAHLLNVNERLNLLGGLVIGFELIKTDNEFYLDEWTYLNVIPFYSTPASKGVHVFTSIPIVDKVHTRIGWYLLHTAPYSYLGVDSPDEVDSSSFYVQLRLGF